MKDRSEQSIREIVIVGGGTAGWMTAAALSHRLATTGTNIRLIESAEIGTVGVGEATLPQIRDFNRMLGIKEAELMGRTSATIKLGIEFRDWGKTGDHYIHPFGVHGEPIGPADFHHYWVKARAEGAAEEFGRYSLPIAAARRLKFNLPPGNPDSLLQSYSYAFQFDASLYAVFLAEYAEARGTRRIEGKVVSVKCDGDNGFIRSLTLESGEQITGDLFIDCSGFRGLLIEQELQTGFADWSDYLPCNRAFAVPCAISDPVGPFTRSTARSAGWQWRIPLQHRIGNGHVYCDRYIRDQDAVDMLMDNLEGEPIAEPKQLFFKTGKRKKLWNRNCIAIGLSGGFLEPLESTSIDLIQSGIMNLLAFFPEKQCAASDADEYNRLMDLEFDRVRDFLMLHYVLNQREEPFWRDMREMAWPDSLREKVEAFERRGLVPQYDQGLFQPASWLSVFIGQNLLPKTWDLRVDAMAADRRSAALQRIKAAIDDSAGRMSEHLAFIETYRAKFAGSNGDMQ
ncbi:tryptophan halogenase family protein [Sphingorhabdus sp. 109]|uniref:tryptophan halogenase family protein n=1 Tax=Sphingorhabdus sp. 109 TaxID=2653173 RepID=UPI0012EF36B4|nr:tryptophan halogenase family protein [Sphingorhabdus sp. 109]VWX57635.1 Flavin-dependent tryptophan halogenase RebH [Sphingorhabdus sp. 109]